MASHEWIEGRGPDCTISRAEYDRVRQNYWHLQLGLLATPPSLELLVSAPRPLIKPTPLLKPLKAMLPPTTSSYVCDTLPAPRLASVVSRSELQPERSPSPPSSFVQVSDDMIVINRADGEQSTANEGQIDLRSPSPPPARKLCVRHQRMADEGTNLKLQQVSP